MSQAADLPTIDDDDARLASLGYQPQLHRVLGLFSNFSVAFTYLSPMVGIYSLFVLGLGTGGPAYIWLNFIPIIGMLFVALVFGELASHYPVAGALYQYSKFSVGPGYGWFVGWFYGFALLVTVASVDTGVVGYVAALTHNWFGWNLDPADHFTILWITVLLLVIQTILNITGAQVMGLVARFGVFVEIIGTFGIAVILAFHGFHHGFGYLFSTQGVTHAATNPLGLDFHGSWLAAALIAVLAPVYIYYGFESAGDISEETKDAGRQVPRAMRLAVIWGGVGSIVLTAALLLAIPGDGNKGVTDAVTGGVPSILDQLPSGIQDFLLLMIIFAFFSCGTSIQGAGSRLAFSYARDEALPGSSWISRVHSALRHPGQRADRRSSGLVPLHAADVRLTCGGQALPVHHLPRWRERAGGAGVVRRQRHLPVVPDDGDRRLGGTLPRLGARRTLHARPLGYDGHRDRDPVPRADVAERRGSDGTRLPAGRPSTSTGSRCW